MNIVAPHKNMAKDQSQRRKQASIHNIHSETNYFFLQTSKVRLLSVILCLSTKSK